MIAPGLRALAVPLGDLTPDPANARKHPEGNIEGVKGSLTVYGQRKPVVANRRTGHVLAGNGTLEAARQLGWTHLAVVWVDDDPATAAGYAVADNRTAELAGWDNEALDRLLREANTGNNPQLDAMLSELAVETRIVPPEEPPARPPQATPRGWKEIAEEDVPVSCPHCGHEFAVESRPAHQPGATRRAPAAWPAPTASSCTASGPTPGCGPPSWPACRRPPSTWTPTRRR
jgi:ParB family chromosome partitioning protein